jgi:transaldolase
VAYGAFKRVFSGPRWEALAAKGANLQRPLWASTSTKNPAYPDTLYISELIGLHTVNTIPENALMAFADHGEVRGSTVEEDVEAAYRIMEQLVESGISLQDIVERRLIDEGAGLFVDSFDRLLAGLQKKCDAVLAL